MKIKTPPVLLFLFSILVTIISCEQKTMDTMDETENQLREKANELAQKLLIIDGHIDVPYRLQSTPEDISVRTERGHFDYPRAKEGGLNAPFIVVYTPAPYEQNGGGKKYADNLIDMVYSFIQNHPDKFASAKSIEEIKQNFINGLVSFPMGMENGTPIEGDINNIKYFYDRGIRYITLAHSKSNHICDSSYDEERKWNGLSPFGIEVVKEMNKLGIMIDVSHVSDSTFYDVIHNSKTPVIASHSSCRKYTPDWERNMNDEMIKTLAYHGGIIMINFGSSFLDGDVRKKSSKAWDRIAVLLNENNLTFGTAAAHKLMDEFFAANHPGKVPISKVVDHIDHVVKLVGIDYVGFGSDFDGVYFVPEGLEDVSKYPNLIFELLKRGYNEEEIKKICSGNFLRVWKQVESYVEQNMK
ncbi:MAG: dipeptidase [Ignavibacteria bacterium]|nr:dipeptidase [Ignavibacteria bacterium]MBT8392506.1 dipeptidase [Ignavibacteria bacterium]NNJ53914.1 membrane dipeptidase [Ignavibacteriaceae bacterium]NNL19781.1 membrane dipeptidase [Ignavibacteriaceae bacterium]